ncbi:MAG: NusA-like transcription termination signal-binding factor [Candidatus Altiarchaeota archaeon]
MGRIRLDSDDIKHITLFESMTHAKVKDYLQDGQTMCFLVGTGDMGLAIGKKGVKIDRVRRALNKNLIIMEYSEDPEQFLKNLFHPATIHGINIAKTSGGTTAQVQIAHEDRSKAIGPGGVKIRLIKQLAKRHHDIDELSLRTL